MVEKAWNIEVWGSQLCRLCKKQDATKEALRKWTKEIFGNIKMRISSLMQKLKEIQGNPISKENNRVEIGLQNELNEWLYRSEVLWRQKSRELWLKEGDKNSRFFHLSTIVRRRRNTIEAVKNNVRDWIIEPKEIRNVFFWKILRYYSVKKRLKLRSNWMILSTLASRMWRTNCYVAFPPQKTSGILCSK